MSIVEKYNQGWWARQTKRARIIILAAVAIIVLAIALGVGLGVGLNRGGDDDEDGSGGSGPNNGGGGSNPDNGNSTMGPAPNGTYAVNATWQIILFAPIVLEANAKTVTPDVPVWDIDLYTNNASTIATLKRLGRTVICYFSAGSYENYRPDSKNFTESDMGKELDGWPGERWLNTNSQNVRNIMVSRIKLARQKGCDAIDPDNIDGYDNDNGVNLSEDTAVDYMKFLSTEAKKLGLAIGLKNSGAIVQKVLPITDFAVNEQCAQYSECASWAPYISANKPVGSPISFSFLILWNGMKSILCLPRDIIQAIKDPSSI